MNALIGSRSSRPGLVVVEAESEAPVPPHAALTRAVAPDKTARAGRIDVRISETSRKLGASTSGQHTTHCSILVWTILAPAHDRTSTITISARPPRSLAGTFSLPAWQPPRPLATRRTRRAGRPTRLGALHRAPRSARRLRPHLFSPSKRQQSHQQRPQRRFPNSAKP